MGPLDFVVNPEQLADVVLAALVEKWLPLLQERSEDSALPFRFAGHLDAMRTISKEVPELFGYQYMLHRPFHLSCPEPDANQSKDFADIFDDVLHSSRFQLPDENGA